MRRWGIVLATVLFWPVGAEASDCDEARPAWLMCEDFEGGSQGWDTWFAASEFTECNGCIDGSQNPDRVLLLEDAAAAHDGDWSLYMPAAEAAGFQGASLTYRDCDGGQQAGCSLSGHEELYFRTWVRLAPDHQYVHHFLSIAGTRSDAYWESDGNAGCRPNGYRAAGTTVDFNENHELFFYTYFPGMNCDMGGYCDGQYAQDICDGCAGKDMPCENGLECCWGNHFGPATPVVLQPGEWTCIEMHMKLNTPGQSDGTMAFWVDDELAHEETSMHWRDVPELQLNKAWLQHYIAGGDADQSNQAWFDDVIVSTERIGCSASMDPDGTGTGTGGGGTGTGDGGTGTGGDGGGDGGGTGGDGGGGDGSTGGGSGTGAGGDGSGSSGCGCAADVDRRALALGIPVLLVAARRRRPA